MELCTACGASPVLIKKRGLCVKCYNKHRKENPDMFKPLMVSIPRHDKNDNSPLVSGRGFYLHERELDFIRNYFKHSDWVAKPVMFNLSNDIKYTPDFYDSVTNTFIEVAGTRQAYHINKNKYELLKSKFPQIKFEIRKSDGSLLTTDKNGLFSWPCDITTEG